ncbi:MAG: hypothetical protein IJD43_05185 [Thermoguttaceae bacterium]|nr:hypothetical protein [Thermoguttaceae bacterium]
MKNWKNLQIWKFPHFFAKNCAGKAPTPLTQSEKNATLMGKLIQGGSRFRHSAWTTS